MRRLRPDHEPTPPRAVAGKPLWRAAISAEPLGETAPAIVHDVLDSPGRPLDAATRAFMEPRFGHDFGRVRVHTDARAAASVRAVGALAYTVGSHIAFEAGHYRPEDAGGRDLLAHELAHTVQQQGAPATRPAVGAPGSASEQDASRAARALVTGTPVPTLRPAAQQLMRRHLFTSTITMKHRYLRSRSFQVTQGGIVVSASAIYERLGTPGCSEGAYHMTLVKEEWFDDSYGSCDFPQGRPVRHEWADLPHGTYYLEIWTGNTNPYCQLVGDIVVEEVSGLTGPSCTVQPPGPLETLHTALDLAGLVPVLGTFADLANAGIYGIEGDWVNAGISAVSIVPVFGDAASVARVGTRTALKVEGSAVTLLGKDAIVAGLNDAKAARKGLGEATENVASGTGRKVDPDVDRMVERGIREEGAMVPKPASRPRPQAPPTRGTASAARESFNAARPDYARRLGVGHGGQVHHAIELQVLDRYPGVFKAQDLNDFTNMRGIATEREGLRQLHNSKIREIWDRHYRAMDAEISARGLRPGTHAYDDFVRRFLENGRDEIDHVLSQFFTEYRKGLTWTRP